jgi:hypothetical protein
MNKIGMALLVLFLIISFITLAIKFPKAAAFLACCYLIFIFSQWFLEE